MSMEVAEISSSLLADAIRQRFRVDVFAQALDVTDAGVVHNFVNVVTEKFGGVDICVTNAGGPPAKGFLAASIEALTNFALRNIMTAAGYSRTHAADMKLDVA